MSLSSLFYLVGTAAVFAMGCAAAIVVMRTLARVPRNPDADTISAMVARSSDALLCFGPDLRCTFASTAATRLLGLPPRNLIGSAIASLLPPEGQNAITIAIEQARGGLDGAEAQIRLPSARGEQVWIEARLSAAAEDDGFVASLLDISIRKTTELALRVANTELNRLAGSDAVTGLANRRRFEQMLESACRRASRQSTPVSMLLIDIDAFFDQDGEPDGEGYLQRITGAIRDALGCSFDAAARFAGAEFAVMLPGRDKAAALAEADRIRDAILAVASARGGARNGSSNSARVGCATVRPNPDRPPAAIATSLIAGASRALEEDRPMVRGRVAPGQSHLSGLSNVAA